MDTGSSHDEARVDDVGRLAALVSALECYALDIAWKDRERLSSDSPPVDAQSRHRETAPHQGFGDET